MASDKVKDRDHPESARPAGARGTAGDAGTAGHAGGGAAASDAAGGQHHAASAHGRAARIDKSLPADRAALIALHADARRRRAAAALGSEAYRAAADEICRIEIRIADVDRAAETPRG
ncbi:MAG TPA: hypothetical protein VIK65_00685 [Candidatus Limnocylindrales bacterium]|jgi:hypothetical protein